MTPAAVLHVRFARLIALKWQWLDIAQRPPTGREVDRGYQAAMKDCADELAALMFDVLRKRFKNDADTELAMRALMAATHTAHGEAERDIPQGAEQ